ncbi:MAG: methionyl aminopeptidase [Candidatus Atribacteria bacterium]|jgi:methionyl aminopeptidase|uniref:Methionine aminopeptidase n=1 Tax=Thermatribacter velox TaxID=3039681 RepID=A0ABZ2YCI7_9BACT|nr:methionyl aminopeptidase [Candidatus Atribacteria bacterium]MDI3530743.1 methionyl aminopeptidase [Candidatus Atribacteria bacterium]
MSRITSPEDVKKIKRSGQILASVIEKLRTLIAPGIKTRFLDEVAENLIRERGAQPAFKGYRGYPASICVSINDQVVHGIPGERVIEKGDLVSIDIGVVYEGFYTDAAFSVVVGNSNPRALRLVEIARKALFAGISNALPGKRIGDISWSIQKTVEKAGFSVVRDFVGHGVGTALHEEPQIPNFGKRKEGPVIEEGMVLAIEPMVNEKDYKVRVLEDGWTVVTLDGGLSAHFEHTIMVTKDGPEVLTVIKRGDEAR